MSYTKHITHVFNPDGSHAGSAVFRAEVVAGRIFDLDPRPIAADDADALSELIPASLTAALAAVDARDATIAARDSTITTLTAERDAAQARVAELEASPVPPLDTDRVIRTYWHHKLYHRHDTAKDAKPYPLEGE
jgi:hypothetical protein